jgi:type IV fimbrial biogenesis protein FimT
MQTENLQSGFTLIELMMTLLVAGIVIGIGAPAFRDLMANSRMTTTTNDLIASISYARSEAVKRAQTVSVTAVGGDWLNGWTVVDQGGTPIRAFEAPSDSMAITVADDNGDDLTIFSFDSRGLLLNQGADSTISICDNRPDETGRQIQISPTGRPNLNRVFADC